jgi:hypothetical protein
VWWGGLPLSGKVGRAAGSSIERLHRCKLVEWRKGIEGKMPLEQSAKDAKKKSENNIPESGKLHDIYLQ